jgi:hypothetical protein
MTTVSVRELMRGARLSDRLERLMLADRLEDNGMAKAAQAVRECSIDLEAQPEDIPVRGNVLFSGDDELDREAENEVIEQLESGNEWAWCTVCVRVFWWDDGYCYEAWDTLACCSYTDEQDFMDCEYYDDMMYEAIAELIEQVEE